MTHVPRAERRARVRRRHRAVGLGPRRLEPDRHADRSATCSRRRSTCSPTWARSRRRCLAGLAAASASTDTTAPTAAITSSPGTVADGTQVTHLRHRRRRRRRRRRGRGGLDRRRHDLAPGHRHDELDVHVDRPRQPVDDAQGARGRRQRQPRRGRAPAPTVNVTCPCSLWGTNTTVPVDDATRAIRRRSRSASSSSPTSSAPSPACASTRRRRTPAPTSAGCGRSPASALAQATFTSESASGWQTVTFGSPVAVQPNTTYVASYYAPNGHYSASAGVLLQRARARPERRRGRRQPAAARRPQHRHHRQRRLQLRRVRARSPATASARANYWVDVIFTPMAVPGTVTGVSATSGGLHLGQRQLVGARDRRRGDLLPDHALRRLDRAGPRRRSPARRR